MSPMIEFIDSQTKDTVIPSVRVYSQPEAFDAKTFSLRLRWLTIGVDLDIHVPWSSRND